MANAWESAPIVGQQSQQPAWMAAPVAEQPQQEPTWGEVGMSAVQNAPRSIAGVVGGVIDAVRHPIQTVTTLGDLAAGGLQNALPQPVTDFVNRFDPNPQAGQRAEQVADAAGQFYKDRYGSVSGIKNALAEDPASVAADAATLLTGVGGAAKLGGLNKLSQLATKAGTTIDPLAATVRAGVGGAKLAGKGAAEIIGALGTRTGGKSIRDAATAGYEGAKGVPGGAQKLEEFTGNLRGTIPMESVLDDARSAVAQMGREKGAAYRQGMSQVSADKTVLDFSGIDQAVNKAGQAVSFKGQAKNARAAQVQQAIAEEISAWKQLAPAEFHTPEGLDALKQRIGGIVESLPFEEKTARMAGREIYNAVKAEITKQAPVYSKTMKDYSEASELITEIERALSLGNRAAADTAMRKLQSLTRNNANTNYGNRLELAQELEQHGAPNLLSNLSGQALNSWTARGLGGMLQGATAGIGAGTMNPAAIPLLAAQSPRLMGEAALATGRAAGTVARGAENANALLGRLGINPVVAGNYLYQLSQER